MERFCPDQLAAKSVQEIFHAVQVYGNATSTGYGDAFVPETSTFNWYDVNGDPVVEDRPSSPSPTHGAFDQDGYLYTTKPGPNGIEIEKFFGFDPAMGLIGGFVAGQPNNVGGAGQQVPNFAANALANDPRVIDIAQVQEGVPAGGVTTVISSVTIKTNEILVVVVAKHTSIADMTFTVFHGANQLTADEQQDNGDFRLEVLSYRPAVETSAAIEINHFVVGQGRVAAIAFKIIQLATAAIDAVADDSGTSTTPNSTAAGPTTVAKEVVIGAVGTRGPLSDDAGTWGVSLLAHQRIGTEALPAAANATVATAYRIVYATGSFTASKSGITSRAWAAITATYK